MGLAGIGWLVMLAPLLPAMVLVMRARPARAGWWWAGMACDIGLLAAGIVLTANAFMHHPQPGWAFEPDGTQRLMAARPGAVSGVLLAALAIAFMASSRPKQGLLAKGLALFVGMSALYVLAGYAYTAIEGSRFQAQLATPLPTSIALIALAHAVLTAAHGRTLLTSSALARGLLSGAVLLPMLGGWHLWHQAVQTADRASKVAFDRHAERVEKQIVSELARYERVLRDTASALAVGGEMSRPQWRDYVAGLDLQASLPGVRGVGYAPFIGPANGQALVARMRAQGVADYHLWPASGRAAQLPVMYLEPLDDRNHRALGYDLLSEAVRERAVSCAIRQGQPCASGKVTLVQEQGKFAQPAFLLFTPVHRQKAPGTPHGSDIVGMAYMAFRAPDLLESMRQALDPEVIFRIYDGRSSSEAGLMFSSDPALHHRSLYESIKTVKLFGQPWTFVFQSTPAFEKEAMAALPNASRYGGVVIALLTFALVSLLVMERSAELARSREDMLKLQALNARLEAEMLARGLADAALRETGIRFKTVADASPLGIFVTDRDGQCQYTNLSYQAISGLDHAQTLGEGWLHAIHPDDAARVAREWAQAAAKDEPYRSEHRFRRADGSEVWTRVAAARMNDGEQVLGYVGLVENITQARAQQQHIAAALGEKETLLREVYHRVKNNLQVIQSLLSLQRRTVPQGPVRIAIDDTVQRVRAMALVHEQLYKSANLAAVSLQEYTRDLLKQIGEGSGARQRHIAIYSEIATISTGLDNAVPFGLLLNELVSNCIKHAFPNGRSGEVRVILTRKDDGSALLKVSDDGVGLPPGFEFDQCESMGLKLVMSLAKQLGGHIEVSAGRQGTVFQTFITRL